MFVVFTWKDLRYAFNGQSQYVSNFKSLRMNLKKSCQFETLRGTPSRPWELVVGGPFERFQFHSVFC